ncbi:MAG: CocE/NonD family hydrolase [Pseudomonadota bacterium]
MKYVERFPREIKEISDMGIEMPDGTRLSARVWMPMDALENPVGAILELIPYRKRDGTVARDELGHPWFAGNGFASVRVDIRGNGESEGLMFDEYTSQELQDGCDIIQWISEQDWCNGNVGMMGISWGGFNALQVAALAPPALKAIITVCSTVDRYADDIHYKGGCLLGENFGWSSQMLSYSSRPPDPKLVGDNSWLEMWKHRLENIPLNWSEWHRHQHRDDYWRHGSVCEDYSAVKASVLSVGGWHDGYRNTISHLVENLSAPVKGIVGPWIHKYPHYAGPQPAIGFLQEAKRWWDRWLYDVDTGVEHDPDYRTWLMDSLPPKRWWEERPGRWIAEEIWPSPNVQDLRLHLGDGILSETDSEIDIAILSPADCGMAGGEYFPFAFSDEFPDEQSHDDQRSACFDGAKLSEPIDIVGAPLVRLRVCSDKPCGQICVRLCDLRPDGTSAFITHGNFNLTHHASHEFPEALIPGRFVDVAFALDQIAYRVPAGHRLRIAISTGYWPLTWPSPEAATLTLKNGDLQIPVRPGTDANEWTFQAPEASKPWQHDVLRPSSYTRNTFMEEATGESVMTIDYDAGENRDLEHGLVSGSWTRERWSVLPDDPTSATAEIEWEQTGGRDGQMWRTEVISKMWCDREHFYTTAVLKCWLNDETFHETEFRDQVARRLV